jgi:hypothetical protein
MDSNVVSLKERLKSGRGVIQDIMDRAGERTMAQAMGEADDGQVRIQVKLAITAAAVHPECQEDADEAVKLAGLEGEYLTIPQLCKEWGFKQGMVNFLIDNGRLHVDYGRRGVRLVRLEDAIRVLAVPTRGGGRPVERMAAE